MPYVCVCTVRLFLSPPSLRGLYNSIIGLEMESIQLNPSKKKKEREQKRSFGGIDLIINQLHTNEN